MSRVNKHVEEFLDYYYSLENAPGYAVMIKGRWGVGKTWFIEKSLRRFEENKGKHLYVSLYGVTKYSEIEDEFFRQLHPFLASKGMALTAKIAKSFFKTALKIDLSDMGGTKGEHNYLTINSQVPDLNISSFLKDPSGSVLVFDDLERSAIDVNDLLGYINYFVEHQGYKVVIIANEEEIYTSESESKNENDLRKYLRVKEKLIGKTFELKSDLESAIDNFINGVSPTNLISFYQTNKQLIMDLYIQSGYENLRHLKYALWDFSRLCNELNDKYTTNQQVISKLLRIYFILSFELKSATIKPSDIRSFKQEFYSSFYLTNKKEDILNPSPFKKISSKYSSADLTNLILTEEIWISILDAGKLSKNDIEECLDKTEYFKTENSEPWVRLWHHMELSDKEFNKFLTEVNTSFINNFYKDINVLKHVVGILLLLSDIGLNIESPENIYNKAIECVDLLKNEGNLKANINSRNLGFHKASWGGLGYCSKDNIYFKKFCEHILFQQESLLPETLKAEASELISILSVNSQKFIDTFIYNNSLYNNYHDVPIFIYMDFDSFISVYLNLKPMERFSVSFALLARYEHGTFMEKLRIEVDFIEKLKTALEKYILENQGKLSAYQNNNILNQAIIPAYEKLMAN